MRKRIISAADGRPAPAEEAWLALAPLVQVEVTSEDPAATIEAALEPGASGEGSGVGWRAAGAGPQTVRLCFDAPQHLRRIRLRFREPVIPRTQEFVLRWSGADRRSTRELVRQQWTFSPEGSVEETEDYAVDLAGVTTLELTIMPDIAGGVARAALAEWRLA
jgi:hypothetical protein